MPSRCPSRTIWLLRFPASWIGAIASFLCPALTDPCAANVRKMVIRLQLQNGELKGAMACPFFVSLPVYLHHSRAKEMPGKERRYGQTRFQVNAPSAEEG